MLGFHYDLAAQLLNIAKVMVMATPFVMSCIKTCLDSLCVLPLMAAVLSESEKNTGCIVVYIYRGRLANCIVSI